MNDTLHIAECAQQMQLSCSNRRENKMYDQFLLLQSWTKTTSPLCLDRRSTCTMHMERTVIACRPSSVASPVASPEDVT